MGKPIRPMPSNAMFMVFLVLLGTRIALPAYRRLRYSPQRLSRG
jgi:hypothetical protein